MATKFKFEVLLTNFKRDQPQLAKLVAAANTNEYVANFSRQAYNGKAWKEVRRRIKGTREYEYPKKKGKSRRTKPILVMRGFLRRAVAGSLKTATFKRIEWNVQALSKDGFNYAKVHNNGLGRMPKRQFIGWTKRNDRITRDIITAFEKKLLLSQFNSR